MQQREAVKLGELQQQKLHITHVVCRNTVTFVISDTLVGNCCGPIQVHSVRVQHSARRMSKASCYAVHTDTEAFCLSSCDITQTPAEKSPALIILGSDVVYSCSLEFHSLLQTRMERENRRNDCGTKKVIGKNCHTMSQPRKSGLQKGITTDFSV